VDIVEIPLKFTKFLIVRCYIYANKVMNRVMPKSGKSSLLSLLFGIAGLVLGIAASVIGLIVHYHTLLSTGIGSVLIALGGAAEGYFLGVRRVATGMSKGVEQPKVSQAPKV
jgi:hypothetical protein